MRLVLLLLVACSSSAPRPAPPPPTAPTPPPETPAANLIAGCSPGGILTAAGSLPPNCTHRVARCCYATLADACVALDCPNDCERSPGEMYPDEPRCKSR